MTKGNLNLVLLGPPGAGKGTQAKMLTDKYKIPQVSTGDILRKAAAAGTGLGKKAKTYMDKGDLVPDEVVIGLVRERIKEPDCENGYILDGFPRTVKQAESLDTILEEMGGGLSHVVSIEVVEDELVKRLTGRRTCKKCGAMYHVMFDPPEIKDICNKCGGELYQRDDDKQETIVSRLKVYKEQTEPLISYYNDRGLTKNIPGTGEIRDIFERIIEILDN